MNKKHQPLKLASIVLLCCSTTFVNAEPLLSIYEQAVQNDHQFQGAKAAFKAGKESKALGRAGLMPKINASGVWTDSETRLGQVTPSEGVLRDDLGDLITDKTTKTYTVGLEQPIINIGAWYGYQRGKAEAQSAAANFVAAEQSLIVRTASAYFDALKAVDNLETATAEEEALSHQLQQTKQRFEVGLTAITEVHEAQAALDSATAARLLAEGQVGISFEALEVITGKSYQYLNPLNPEFPVTLPSPSDREEWVNFALQNNASLKSASYQADSARSQAKSARAGHLPTLTGGISYTNSNSDPAEQPTEDFSFEQTERQEITLTLSVPIYNGGQTSASRRQANQLAIQARENFYQAQRNTIQSTRSIHLNVLTGVATVKARKQAITSNQSALEATQAGYDVGTRDLVDVLNAQRNLYRAQRDYYDSLYTYILNTLQLKEAAGNLSSQDIEELNNWLDLTKQVKRS